MANCVPITIVNFWSLVVIAMASTTSRPGGRIIEFASASSERGISRDHRKADQTPSEPILPPQPSGKYNVDESVRACRSNLQNVVSSYSYLSALAMPGSKITHAQNYGMSLWGKTAKMIIELPSGEEKAYFLKVGPFLVCDVYNS